jgi:hypothetical protein
MVHPTTAPPKIAGISSILSRHASSPAAASSSAAVGGGAGKPLVEADAQPRPRGCSCSCRRSVARRAGITASWRPLLALFGAISSVPTPRRPTITTAAAPAAWGKAARILPMLRMPVWSPAHISVGSVRFTAEARSSSAALPGCLLLLVCSSCCRWRHARPRSQQCIFAATADQRSPCCWEGHRPSGHLGCLISC